MKKLDGKIAIVTGGVGNVGRAIVEKLAQEGALVTIFDINSDKLLLEELKRATLNVDYKAIDVTDSMAVNTAVGEIIDKYGAIDVLVNGAGICSFHEKSLLTVTDEIWDKEIAVNLTGTFICSRAVLAQMEVQKSGKIINITSVAGETGRYGVSSAYSSAKAGVYGLTMSMARNVARFGINVNCVSPGVIATNALDSIPTEMVERLMLEIPSIRKGIPEDVANAVLFLSSTASDYVTGSKIQLNGGSFMS